MKKLVIGLILLSGLISANVIAAGLKVGVVSVERILTEAPQVDAVNTSMLERFEPLRDELQKAEKDITKLQQNYKRNELVLTEDQADDCGSPVGGHA